MISTPLVSFIPGSAAQPTDVLRRDNNVREVVTPLHSNQPFQRERGIGSDAERRAQTYPRSYPDQMAQARQEAGFPGFLRHSTRAFSDPSGVARNLDPAPAAVELNLSTAFTSAQVQRDDEPFSIRYIQTERPGALHYDWRRYQQEDMDSRIMERGRRIEAYYQSSFRANEQYLIATV